MQVTTHYISRRSFSQVASGGGGQSAVQPLIAAQRSKHILLLRRVVDLSRSAQHEEASLAENSYRLLARIQDQEPDAVNAVVQHPAVAAWARQTIKTLGSSPANADAHPGRIAALSAAAAIRARFACQTDVAADDGHVVLPSVGRATAVTGRVMISGEKGVTVDGRVLPDDLATDCPGWQGLRRLSGTYDGQSTELLIDDVDPFRALESSAAAPRLSAAELVQWQAVFGGAWKLLVRTHRGTAEEVASLIRVLTPLKTPVDGHVSATSRNSFGAILLSAPPDACSLAVTLAHEVQHAKLSALIDMVPLTLPDDGRRFYAPWRSDPRPISGLLQGAYAFLGVAGFWLRQGGLPDNELAPAEFVRWRDAVRVVVDTLAASNRLTEPGHIFVAGMDQTLGRWEAESVSAEAQTRARRAAEEHQERWRQVNGEIHAWS